MFGANGGWVLIHDGLEYQADAIVCLQVIGTSVVCGNTLVGDLPNLRTCVVNNGFEWSCVVAE